MQNATCVGNELEIELFKELKLIGIKKPLYNLIFHEAECESKNFDILEIQRFEMLEYLGLHSPSNELQNLKSSFVKLFGQVGEKRSIKCYFSFISTKLLILRFFSFG